MMFGWWESRESREKGEYRNHENSIAFDKKLASPDIGSFFNFISLAEESTKEIIKSIRKTIKELKTWKYKGKFSTRMWVIFTCDLTH